MKKIMRASILLPLCVSAAFGADLIVTEDTTYNATADNVIYKASASVKNGSALNIKNGIQVDSGVDAVWNNSASSSKFNYVGSDTYTAGYISGAGKELSSFTFTGYHLSAKRQDNTACGILTVSDIMLSYWGSYNGTSKTTNGGYFRMGQLVLENTLLDFEEGTFNLARTNGTGPTSGDPTVQMTNSTFNYNSTANWITTADAVGTKFNLDNSTLNVNANGVGLGTSGVKFQYNLTNGSAVNLNGNSLKLRSANWNLDNSTLNVAGNYISFEGANGEGTGIVALSNGSTLNMTGASTTSVITVTNDSSTVNVGAGALLNAGITIANNAKFTGEGSIAYENRGSPATVMNGTSYLNTSTINLYKIDHNNDHGVIYVGVDELGSEKTVNLTIGSGVQANNGYFVIKGGSTVSVGGNFNVADVQTEKRSIIGEGANLTIGGASRLNVATISGAVNVGGGAAITNYGWDYVFALGVLSTKNAAGTEWASSGGIQQGNAIIESTATINVNIDDTYTGDRGAFTMAGTLTSYAGEAAIKSGQYSPFVIKSNVWDASHQSVLTLNSTDAFAVGGAASQAASTFWLDASANVKIVVNAENNIGAINFAGVQTNVGAHGDNILTLDLNANLTVGEFTGDLVKIILGDDLDKNMFKITNMAAILADYVSTGSSDTLKFLSDSTTERVLNSNLFIEDLGGDVYTIYTVAIPEPAEWAFIFGALALGVVAYRRRK